MSSTTVTFCPSQKFNVSINSLLSHFYWKFNIQVFIGRKFCTLFYGKPPSDLCYYNNSISYWSQKLHFIIIVLECVFLVYLFDYFFLKFLKLELKWKFFLVSMLIIFIKEVIIKDYPWLYFIKIIIFFVISIILLYTDVYKIFYVYCF